MKRKAVSVAKAKADPADGIGYCDFPQEVRRSLPDAGEAPASAPVTSVEECLSSPVVTTANFTADPQLENALRVLFRRRSAEASPAPLALRALAPREREILLLATQGMSNKQIAQRLDLSLITVGKTLTRAYAKLGSRNRAEAVRKFMMSQDA
jgi:DNA-binding NarL/FixJ family response regulator